MNATDCRREAARILRDASGAMRRDLAEAERLLALAEGEGDDAAAVRVRRAVEHEREINPEFFTRLEP